LETGSSEFSRIIPMTHHASSAQLSITDGPFEDPLNPKIGYHA
jgi:hypothetical protein